MPLSPRVLAARPLTSVARLRRTPLVASPVSIVLTPSEPSGRVEDFLRDTVSQRLARVEATLEILVAKEPTVETVELRELTDHRAREEMRAYFEKHHGEILFADEVAEALSIDVEQSIRLCEVLRREGKIAEAARAQTD